MSHTDVQCIGICGHCPQRRFKLNTFNPNFVSALEVVQKIVVMYDHQSELMLG